MIENLQKIQTYQIKSKPIVGSVVFCLSFFLFFLAPPSKSSDWFELDILGTEACQSAHTPPPGLQFSCFCLASWRLGSWSWVTCLFRSGPVGGQMRVSWCHRLDGRMLSTFSMMKFRGANSVLRNCRETQRHKTLKPLLPIRVII